MQDSGASAMQAALPHTHDARTGAAKHVHIAAECPYAGNHIEMLPPTSELTEYYRSRCEGFQRLEEDYIARLETLQLSVEERHQARWQFLRAQGEVEDLQEALSDAKVAYFDERERAIALAGENDTLKLQEVEDRNRIQQLLALSQPVTDEVTILRDRGHLPVKAPLPIEGPGGGLLSDVTRSKLALAQQQQVRQPAQSSSLIVNSGALVRGVSANAMSNKILLPEGASIEGLVFELQSLRLQAEENKRLWREKEEVLLEDRRVKVHEARAMRERHAAQLEALEAKVRTLEADLCAATKDYLLVRHTSAKQVAEAREAEALARHNAQELFARFQEYSSKTAAEVQGAAQAVRRRDADAMQAHLAQAQHADAEVLRLQTQLAAEAIASRQREEALVSKLEQQHRRNTQLESRRKLDIQGLASDLASIKRQLRPLVPAVHQLLRHGGAGGIGAPASATAERRPATAASTRVRAPLGGSVGHGNTIRAPIHEPKKPPKVSPEEVCAQLNALLLAVDRVDGKVDAHVAADREDREEAYAQFQ